MTDYDREAIQKAKAMAESEGWEKTFQITGISPGQVGLSAAQPEDIPRPPAVTAGEVNRKLSSAR